MEAVNSTQYTPAARKSYSVHRGILYGQGELTFNTLSYFVNNQTHTGQSILCIS